MPRLLRNTESLGLSLVPLTFLRIPYRILLRLLSDLPAIVSVLCYDAVTLITSQQPFQPSCVPVLPRTGFLYPCRVQPYGGSEFLLPPGRATAYLFLPA